MSSDKITILLIRGERNAAGDTARLLEECGYTVRVSQGPREAVMKAVRQHNPDLLIVDAFGKGRTALTAVVRSIQLQKDIPVIFIITAGDPVFFARLKETGCSSILEPPFSNALLEHTIENTLARHKSHRHAINMRQRYELMVQRIPLGIIEFTPGSGTILKANQKAASITGYGNSRDMEGISIEALIADESLRNNLVKRLMKHRFCHEPVAMISGVDGKHFWAELTAWRDSNEDTAQILIADRSLEKQMHESLAESERLYRLMASNTTDVVWIRDMDLKLSYISPSVSRIQGYSPEEVMAQSIDDSFTPSSLMRVLEIFNEEKERDKEKGADPGRSRTFEIEAKMRDGTTRWYEVNALFLRDENGTPTGILGVDRDITERKKAEASLRESEEKFRTLVENINEIIYVLDQRGYFTYISPVVERRYGIRPDEMLGRHYSEFIHPDDLHVASRGGKSDEAAYSTPIEYRAVNGKGNTAFLRSSSRLLYLNGKLVGETGVLTDITEERLAERIILAQRDLAVRLSASLEIDEAIKAVLETVLGLPGIIYGNIYSLNGETGNLELMMSLGGDGIPGEKPRPLKAGLFCNSVTEAKHYATDAYLMLIPERTKNKILRRYGQWESFAICDEEQTVALINAASGHGEPIPVNTMAALGAIAAQTADAIARINAAAMFREREEFFATVLNNLRDLVLIYDLKNKKYTYANSHTRQLYGIEPEEYLTLPFGTQMSRTDAQKLLRDLKNEIVHDSERDQNRVREYTVLERHRSGKYFWAELRATFIRDKDGTPISVINIIRDISEKKKDEEELRFRNNFEDLIARMSTKFINLPGDRVKQGLHEALKSIGKFAGVDRSYIFLMSEDGRNVSKTHEWRAPGIEIHKTQMQNVPVENLPGLMGTLFRFSEVYIPDVAALPPDIEKEKRLLLKQGIKSLVAVPMVSDKILRGFIGFDTVRKEKTWSKDIINLLRIVAEIFVNLLNRQKAERSLRIYERIVSSSRDIILFVDAGYRVQAANDTFCNVFKSKFKNVIGCHIEEVFDAGEYESILKDQLRHASEGREARFEMWHELPGLDQRCLDVTISPFREKKSMVTGFIINFRDITERIQTEAKVLGVIESERRKIGMELHDGLSHRLLGVAISSKMLAEKLKEDLPGAVMDASTIEERINSCIGEVRDLARGLNPFRHDHICLEDRIEELCSMISTKYDIQCSLRYKNPVQVVNLNMIEQVYYIVHEAIFNAVKHSGAKNIQVNIDSKKGVASCTVKDDGRGMPVREKRVKGMGLDIMRYRARMIGATLKIKSGKKIGTHIQCSFRQ